MTMLFKVFSIVVTALFCWIIYPYKWIRKWLFFRRKRKAVEECRKMALANGCRFYVVQNGLNFYVQNRYVLRKWNVKNRRKTHAAFDIDYRNAIVYHCDANGADKFYERDFKK